MPDDSDVTSGELVPIEEPVSAEVAKLRQDDAERVLEYIGVDLSPNTERAYRNHLTNFARWCSTRGWSPMPATEETVIAYLTDACRRPEPNRMRPSSAKVVKSAISVMHDNANQPNPTRGPALKNALKRLDREFKGGHVERVEPLLIEDVDQVTRADPESLPELRDAAIIWCSYGGLMRRSEVVALDVDDIQTYRARMENGTTERRTRLHIRSSKTDQTGEGAYVDIPTPAVEALTAWLTKSGITRGAVFRPFNHGKIVDRRLSPQVVALIMKKRTAAANLNGRFSGHSGRRGGATEAKANGISDSELARVGRWKSANAMQRYIASAANTNPDERAGVKRKAG